jgi:hypothetical protein
MYVVGVERRHQIRPTRNVVLSDVERKEPLIRSRFRTLVAVPLRHRRTPLVLKMGAGEHAEEALMLSQARKRLLRALLVVLKVVFKPID